MGREWELLGMGGEGRDERVQEVLILLGKGTALTPLKHTCWTTALSCTCTSIGAARGLAVCSPVSLHTWITPLLSPEASSPLRLAVGLLMRSCPGCSYSTATCRPVLALKAMDDLAILPTGKDEGE